MKINKYKLFYTTQTKTFLFCSVFIIIILGLIVSTIVNSTKKEILITKSALNNLYQLQIKEMSQNIYSEELGKVLSNPKLPMEEFLDFIEKIASIQFPTKDLPMPHIDIVKVIDITILQLEKHQHLNPNLSTIACFLKVQKDKSILNDLTTLSISSPPLKYSNRLLAFYYIHNQIDLMKAIDCLKAETSLNESEACKDLLVKLLIKLKKTDDLEQLEDDSHFNSQNNNITKYLLLEKKSWTLLFKDILKSQFDIEFNGIFYLTLLTGLVWFGIWIHALKPEKPLSTIILSLIAFALGVFSTSLTILTIYIEEEVFHLSQGTSILQGILYYIIGVGLREEFCKLLVFIVLIPILIRRQNPIEWLVIPGMVGLGFATEENLNYFLASSATQLPGRFLTANFFHVALTALAGESLCHYYYNRSRGPEHFFSTFSMVIIMHGLYDTFIGVPQLAKDFNIISVIIFIYGAFLYFGRLRELRSRKQEAISLSTHFILGISFLFMCTFIFFSYNVGHYQAFQLLTPTILNLLIFIYLFLYVMPNSIIKL